MNTLVHGVMPAEDTAASAAMTMKDVKVTQEIKPKAEKKPRSFRPFFLSVTRHTSVAFITYALRTPFYILLKLAFIPLCSAHTSLKNLVFLLLK